LWADRSVGHAAAFCHEISRITPKKPAINYAYANEHDQSADTLLARNLRAGTLFSFYRRNPGAQPGFKKGPRKEINQKRPRIQTLMQAATK
jgi:hypothetical protein